MHLISRSYGVNHWPEIVTSCVLGTGTCWAVTAADVVASLLSITRGEGEFIELEFEELVEAVFEKYPPEPDYRVQIASYVRMGNDATEEDVLRALRRHPLAGAVDFTPTFRDFRGSGILEEVGPQKKGRHAFLIVGFGSENGITYYKIQNSWGTNWGENGFAKVRRDLVHSICFPVLRA
ncbi:hypothetical protein RJ640_030723 [Escallonia rubra]|uniref:Peptidase C1A papain C-terminal domain-containing protein n=1 Tax=Escallonia rubra TaxID=112253 RepID=A0AA88U5F1_9ASTE|nr:hypothetical protein RJ640_030723 [Escallonia rubra]